MTRPRVLIYSINYAPEPIGVGRYTSEFGSYLVGQSTDVEVITAVPHYPGWSVRDSYSNRYLVEEVFGARVIRCPLLLRSKMGGIWRLLAPLSFAFTSAPVAIWRILTRCPDVVLCVEPTLFCAPAALFASKLVGARTVLHVQDLEIDAAFAVGHLRGGLFEKVAGWFERAMLRRFDAVVTISNRMREGLQAKGIATERLSVVRNWVDLGKIKPLFGRSGFRDELELADDDFVILYSGNIGPKQALHLLLEVAVHLAEYKKLVFIVAGEGPEKQRLMQTYGYLANVRFLALQPEERLCELLNLADAHVLPQRAGTADLVLPSKLGGMLASGKPSIVMADRNTELWEFLGDCAILISSGDIASLERAILNVFQNSGLLNIQNVKLRTESLDSRKNLAALQEILALGADRL